MGAHIHSKEEQPFHFCETRYVISSGLHDKSKQPRPCSCENCGYFCKLPLGKKLFRKHVRQLTHFARYLKVTLSKNMKLAMDL
jgi:hypothetical protein